MSTFKNYIKYLILFLLLIIVLFVIIEFNSKQISFFLLQFPGIDKILHFFGIIIFVFLSYYVIGHLFKNVSKNFVFNIIICNAFLIGILFEMMQLNIPDRNLEIGDIIANMSGLIFVTTIFYFNKVPKYLSVSILIISILITTILTIKTYQNLRDYNKGIILEQNRKYASAREYYQLAYDTGNRDSGLLNSMAWLDVEFLGGNLDSAHKYSLTAVRNDSTNPDYLDTYAWVLFHQSEYHKSLEYLSKAYEKNPEIFCIHYHLGSSYAALNNYEKSIFHLQKQIEINPNDRDGVAAKMMLMKIDKKDSIQ